MTGKPEVIDSSVGLVPTNALVLTETINSRMVGNTEVIVEPRPREVVISAVCLRVCGYRFVCRVPNSAGLGDGRQPVSRNRGSNSARPRPARIHFRALSVRSPSGVCWGHPESIRGTTASRFDVGLRASARHRSPFHRAHGFRVARC